MSDYINEGAAVVDLSAREERTGGMRPSGRTWSVGMLIKAIAESLESKFSPVTVDGEISGFSRAPSGHCYFLLKDNSGQIRCAMFRRAVALLDFVPKDGQRVQLRGRLGIYEPRGELQLVAETLREAGRGDLFEQYLKLKSRLEADGLFDLVRKRSLTPYPRKIGVVTSLGAAALHDVVSVLQRRVPHIPVVIYPASVQGSSAAMQLREALLTAYRQSEVDVILLVRGGGAIEDLWSFNDEQLARTIVISPVPVVCGVGHETDFTIADFCADVRAPTPTAAAELCAEPQVVLLEKLAATQLQLARRVERGLQSGNQQLDMLISRFDRPSHFFARQAARLVGQSQALRQAHHFLLERKKFRLEALRHELPRSLRQSFQHHSRRQDLAEIRLDTLSPQHVLRRGYAWLADGNGVALTRASKIHAGQALRATLVDGTVDLTASASHLV